MTGDSVGILHCDFMLLIRYEGMDMVILAFKAWSLKWNILIRYEGVDGDASWWEESNCRHSTSRKTSSSEQNTSHSFQKSKFHSSDYFGGNPLQLLSSHPCDSYPVCTASNVFQSFWDGRNLSKWKELLKNILMMHYPCIDKSLLWLGQPDRGLRVPQLCTPSRMILSNDHHHHQIGAYVYHSYILSSLGADSIPASVAPRCSYLIYKPDRREEVRNSDDDDGEGW